MNEVIIYVFVLALFEFYESSWQSGATLQEVINNLYTKYQKGLFYFFFSHPSFIYALYLGIKYDLTNFWFLTILFFKFLNISFELVVIQKLQEQKLHEILPIPLDIKIERWMSYINVILFPLLLFIAFMQTA
ncbi:hypothetical protein [Nitratiruptor tergarcus]|uniref:Uncharacterized protein n=1 Tax=Nitratiruptor tergarcus DSM 16512 TaxID=1069081 RepID=A0A1W1WV53_9BACT|nr:hypothetical protein [Nitratiruptor tergarcus]SMC10157.1 hypothetical protein SAMN05660197_1996 [Nitratiruptor tergarcus DSM 16512]